MTSSIVCCVEVVGMGVIFGFASNVSEVFGGMYPNALYLLDSLRELDCWYAAFALTEECLEACIASVALTASSFARSVTYSARRLWGLNSSGFCDISKCVCTTG